MTFARCAERLVIALCAAAATATRAQSPLETEKTAAREGAQAPAKGGPVTAGLFPPVLDAKQRPITVGGRVTTGPVFKDIAKEAGLTTWQHKMGSAEKRTIVETIGSGVALLDYDTDGWLDIYLVGGSTQEALNGKAVPPVSTNF